MDIQELDFTQSIDFEVVGDIKPTVIEVVGKYDTWMGSDCDLHLSGTTISLPAYWSWLTYWGFCSNEKDVQLIKLLLERGLIKFHAYH